MGRSSVWRGFGLIAAAGLLAGCGGRDEPDPAPQAGSGIAVEVTDPARQPCGGSARCTQIATVAQAHGEPAIGLHYDPGRNDAVVRWSATLAGVIDCADGGGVLGECVAASDAEDQCKAEFDRLSALGGDAAAFDAVFLTPGSPCRPEEGEP
ncbi:MULTISPECIES: hypothetical protein [Hyphobacterium]|uniref:Lipoprotein n=1 Tax=Hyphobacterium vulgare TaxID=1736751 RepID=A0ABV6ZVW3_9PROT